MILYGTLECLRLCIYLLWGYINPTANKNIIGGLDMKRIYITTLTGGIFLILTVLTAGMKEKKGNDFLWINDNIQNKELRAELEGLREEFNLERIRIKDYYNEKVEALKESRKNEIKTIKHNFADRRRILMKKYAGKMRKIPQMEPSETVNKVPLKKKIPKDKKKIRTR